MEQKIINIDSQILNTVQNCARKTQLTFVKHLRPEETAEAIERGDLMHKMLEVYYSKRDDVVNPNAEIWKDLEENGIDDPSPVELAVETGKFYATKMNTPIDELEGIICQFREYVKYYANDGWRALAVEEVGTKVLYEDEKLKILYSVKIDLYAERAGFRAPWDHKTSKRRTELSPLSNQFIGYVWAMESPHIVVNKIGFQKTLSPKERFQREILTYSQDRINEWIENTVWWTKRLVEYHEKDEWPMNWTSCDKYSGCIFRDICEKDPNSRDWIIERDFKVTTPWDVGEKLEITK